MSAILSTSVKKPIVQIWAIWILDPFFNLIWKKEHFEVADVLSHDHLSSLRSIDVQVYTQGVHWNLFELTPLNIQLQVLLQHNFDRVLLPL